MTVKKGSKDKPRNDRLMSPMSVVGNLLEGILRGKIYQYLDRHGFIRRVSMVCAWEFVSHKSEFF